MLFFGVLFSKVVGSDYLGNKYYERGSGAKDGRRSKRLVVYATKDFTSIPPEWDSWLRHTAGDPPSSTRVSDVYCGNASGSPYTQVPQGDVSRKDRKLYSNYKRWMPQ